jgi:hypothetical protein
MKTTFRVIISLFCSAALVVAFSWWYIIHYARTTGLTEQNVNPFMWSVIGASAVAIIGLTTLCYRVVR